MTTLEYKLYPTTTLTVPGFVINYRDGTIESIGMGGELYKRETPLEAKNAELRELCASLYARLRAVSEATDEDWIDARLTKRMQELGILDSTTSQVD